MTGGNKNHFIDADHFAGQAVIVTGASRGIGQATALAFARCGASVVVNYRSDESGAQETLAMIEKAGGKGTIIQGDIGSTADVERLVEETESRIGPIGVVVNNAAAFKYDHFLDVPLEDFDSVMATNVRGVFYLSQLAARHMAKRKKGAIVHISSILAQVVIPTRTVYSSTKGAIESLTRAMAIDLIPHGIRVNCIAPGLIRTVALTGGLSEEAQNTLESYVPGGRFGEPEDLADAVVFLASDLARYVNGVLLPVDCGLSVREAGPPFKK
jgi:NAD(P)-dependent dehydrogenase (short-subunit alcohol dehydrogenase family)